MSSQIEQIDQIEFYSPLATNELRSELEIEMNKLDEKNFEYVIFKSAEFIPKMSWKGFTYMGINNIKNQLNAILDNTHP